MIIESFKIMNDLCDIGPEIFFLNLMMLGEESVVKSYSKEEVDWIRELCI